MNLLILEDDKTLSEDLQHQFQAAGFVTEAAYDGSIGERLALRTAYDCILLDVNMPGKNGFALAQSLRQHDVRTPILMLTAFGEIEDKLAGFESGVDDYVTKPFFFKELLARVKVLIRRSQTAGTRTGVFTIADLTLDPDRKEVRRAGQVLKLTAREYELLHLLLAADGLPVSKKEILQKVWGTSFEANTNTVEVFINLLRNKIDKPFEPKLIKTRIGFGYYLAVD